MIKASALCRRLDGDVQGATVWLRNPLPLGRLIAPQSLRDTAQTWSMIGARQCLSFVVFILYGVFAASVRRHVTSRLRVLA